MAVSLKSSYELSQIGKLMLRGSQGTCPRLKPMRDGSQWHWEGNGSPDYPLHAGAVCLRVQVGGKKGDEREADHWGRLGISTEVPRAVLGALHPQP